MKHTPGPWRIEDVTSQGTMIYRRIVGGNGTAKKHVGFAGAYRMNPASEAQANARLIAAAPELYEKLHESIALLALAQAAITSVEINSKIQRQIDENRAAIAKAEGRE